MTAAIEFLYRNLAAILVFCTMAGITWTYGGTRTAVVAEVLPWLAALTLEGFLLFPQRRPYEDMVQARTRLWDELRHDPLLYVMLAFLLLLAVPILNHGLCPNCDYDAIAAGADASPAVPFFPYCVSVIDHVRVYAWFMPAFLLALAVRHALTRTGKRAFLEMMVWNAAALAVFGFIEQAAGAQAVFWEATEHPRHFFSVFIYPNAAGAFFTMSFAFAIGLWRYRAKETDLLRKAVKKERPIGRSTYWIKAHYPLVPAILVFFAVLHTRSRAAVMFSTILFFAAIVYFALETLGARISRERRARSIAFAGIGLVFAGIAVAIFSPSDISAEMKTADLAAIADRMTGKAEWHVDAALALFRENPVFGIGGWGYKHLSLPYVPENVQQAFGQWYSRGHACVHNDYLQFLCEHGAVGAALLLSVLALLAWPVVSVWNKLYRAARFAKAEFAPQKPRVVFCLPSAAFWILAGDLCLLIHAFGDCPLRGGAVMATLLASLPAAEGFIPRAGEISQDAAMHHAQHGE